MNAISNGGSSAPSRPEVGRHVLATTHVETGEPLPEWQTYPVVEINLTRLTQAIPAHAPDEGRVGDCYRTAIACLLGARDPEWVPHFVEQTMAITHRPGWHQHALARLWLRSELKKDLLTATIAEVDPIGVPYIVAVNSKTGDWPHCVIAQHGEVIHDPSGVGGYTMTDLREDEADMLCFPYDPEPEEMLRRWAVASVEEDFRLAIATALTQEAQDLGLYEPEPAARGSES